MRTLVFQPLIPTALWVTLAVLAVGLWAWYARDCARRLGKRAIGILSLMVVALALPLAVLLNPMWLERIPPPAGKPRLAVLVDRSASMATADPPASVTRLQEAQRIVSALEPLRSQFDIELHAFAATTAPAEPADLATLSADGGSTNIAGAIDEVLQADPVAGQAVLLLSDGIHNAGGGDAQVLESARRARAMAAPIYTKVLGGNVTVRDVAIEVRTPQELAFVGQQVPVIAILKPAGFPNIKAQVTLSMNGQVVERRSVQLGDGPQTELEFLVRQDTSGLFAYQLEVDPLPGEATTANNRCAYVLRVIDEPVRILLLEGKPYWDTKFLMRTLAADPAVELVSVVRLSPTRLIERTLKRAANGPPPAAAVADAPQAQPGGSDDAAGDATRPDATRTEEWSVLADIPDLLSDAKAIGTYQVVVLGRSAESYLTDEALVELKRWLRAGGSLVCFRGAPANQISQRLAQILPVHYSPARESRFRVKLTEAGKDLRWLGRDTADSADQLSNLPSLSLVSEPSNPQFQASTWAVGETSTGSSTPVVTSLPYGTGHVVVVEGAGMWRWAFLPPEYEQHEQIYATLWHSLMRWLVSNAGLLPTQKWSLRSDKVRFDSKESAAAILLVRENLLTAPLPAVELTGEALDAPRSVTPLPTTGEEAGTYRVPFGKLPEGHYVARIAGSADDDAVAHTIFDVRDNMDEILQLAANPSLMSKIAELSGGAVLADANPAEITRQLAEHLARSRPEQVRMTTAWDRWWVLAGILTIWACAWGLRRRSGLV